MNCTSIRSWEGRALSMGWSSEKALWRMLERWFAEWLRDLQVEKDDWTHSRSQMLMGCRALKGPSTVSVRQGRTRVQGQI